MRPETDDSQNKSNTILMTQLRLASAGDVASRVGPAPAHHRAVHVRAGHARVGGLQPAHQRVVADRAGRSAGRRGQVPLPDQHQGERGQRIQHTAQRQK